MSWSGTKIRALAGRGPLVVTLDDGRTFVVRTPGQVAGPEGRHVVLPGGGEAFAIVDPMRITDVAPLVPDPDVEEVRAGRPPRWLLRRLAEQPELFVTAARLDPEALRRALAGLEPGGDR
jgi:hypothetical protein